MVKMRARIAVRAAYGLFPEEVLVPLGQVKTESSVSHNAACAYLMGIS